MSVTIRNATPGDLAQLLPLLDQQFVFGKGRAHSLETRFPGVFCPENALNIFLCEESGAILSALAVKRFDWRENEQVWRGAMIGAVYTNPRRRGEGLASRMLKWCAEKLRESGTDFAVLWTAQPAFYARLGWVAADCGVLGEALGSRAVMNSPTAIVAVRLADADLLRLERIRLRWLTSMSLRRPEDYCQLPIPADSVEVLWPDSGRQEDAYALLGSAGERGIVYEVVGDENGFSALFSQIRSMYRHVLVNDCRGSASNRWLAQHTDIAWHDKPLAMWLAFSDKLDMARIKHWYIPYFDRI